MSEKPKITREEFEAELRYLKEHGWPTEEPKPKPLPPAADVVPFRPWGPRRPWTAEPLATTNAQPYQATDIDRLIELQRANAQAARAERRRRDPFGIWGGAETIDDVVRRQDEGEDLFGMSASGMES
jgi:hypothetical protein